MTDETYFIKKENETSTETTDVTSICPEIAHYTNPARIPQRPNRSVCCFK